MDKPYRSGRSVKQGIRQVKLRRFPTDPSISRQSDAVNDSSPGKVPRPRDAAWRLNTSDSLTAILKPRYLTGLSRGRLHQFRTSLSILRLSHRPVSSHLSQPHPSMLSTFIRTQHIISIRSKHAEALDGST